MLQHQRPVFIVSVCFVNSDDNISEYLIGVDSNRIASIRICFDGVLQTKTGRTEIACLAMALATFRNFPQYRTSASVVNSLWLSY